MSANTRKKVLGFDKQESLQAIVFANDFVDDLKPADQVYPSILLPVITCPLLDYTLETLVRSKVEQVFLYCSSHLESLKTYLDSLKNYHKNINIVPIISDGCRSLGDALRDIDTKGFIRDDFILIRGTAFGNVHLSQLMELHKARKEKDKNTAMTMIFRNLGSMKDSTLKNECSLVVSNSTTKKILLYNKVVPNENKIELDLQWFLEHNKVNIDTSLLDTRIYICSQSVLPLFADNFDFQTMEDFIHGVLINEEFLNSRIYWESLTPPSYAMPISSKETYRILCRDILQRHCYPLVPDTLPVSLRDFLYMSRTTYKHSSSVLSKGSILHSESIIGKNSLLGENSSVKKTVIESNCKIGNNVLIEDSYIFAGTVIEDNCHINNSIIFSNCLLKKNLKIVACTLLPHVICKENHCYAVMEMSDNGKLIVRTIEQFVELCDTNFSSLLCDSKFDSDHDHDDTSSTTSASSSSTNDSPIPQTFEEEVNEETFLSDVIENLLSGYEEKLYHKNVIVEINSSRLAQNISSEQVLYVVIQATFDLPFHFVNKSNETQFKDYYKVLKPVVTYVEPIINNYMKTKSAQKDCLCAIKDVICKNREFMLPYAGNILRLFYDDDILGEDIIIDWYEQNFSESGRASEHYEQDENQDAHEALKKSLLPFITWLKEAEEDSSE